MKKILFLVALSLLAVAQAQTPAPNATMRIQCVKAKPGKLPQLRAFLREVSAKTGKYAVDSGRATMFIISEAVTPAGQSAPCDVQLVTGYPGAPPEPRTLSEDDMQKAGVTMPAKERNALRDDNSYLVSTEYWQLRDGIGRAQKGGYVRVNYFKAGPGNGADWLRMERAGWRRWRRVSCRRRRGLGCG